MSLTHFIVGTINKVKVARKLLTHFIHWLYICPCGSELSNGERWSASETSVRRNHRGDAGGDADTLARGGIALLSVLPVFTLTVVTPSACDPWCLGS